MSAQADSVFRTFVLGTLAVFVLFLAGIDRAKAAQPAVFNVGAASVDVTPDVPLHAGGYGNKAQLISETNDPLEVRAFVVTKGSKALAFVIADTTGWFPEYQGTMQGLGTVNAREEAATKLADRGFTGSSRSDVIVSATHTHAAPTLVGIWGLTDPDYLKKVHDAAVEAVDQAAANLKPSYLWTASGSVRSFVWQNGQGTNHPDGFGIDDQMPVLWARDPDTGATNSLYVNVPNHPDQFNANAQNAFSADWPGYVRDKLGDEIGGTAVIAAGTLGRQEPPGSINNYTEVEKQGEYVTNAVMRTLADAEPIVSDVLNSTESMFTSPADNTGLLTLISLHGSPPAGDRCHAALGSNCTIPRANASPFQLSGPTRIGAVVSSFRIGDLHYTTNPGEAFPEVNDAIRDQVSDAADTRIVGLAGDMLGYYYQRGDYTLNQFGSSNFPTYNVGPDLGVDNVIAAHNNADELGFTTTPSPLTPHAEFDTSIIDKPGIQFYPTKLSSTSTEVDLYVSAVAPQKTEEKPNNNNNTMNPDVVWDFDDGSGPVTSPRSGWTSHVFPGPGTYEVTATATDETNQTTRSWSETIVIDPPLSTDVIVQNRTATEATLIAEADGGSGKVIAAAWICPGESTEKIGPTVTCASTKADTAVLSIIDSSGNTAAGEVDIPAPTCDQDPSQESCIPAEETCEENPNQEKCQPTDETCEQNPNQEKCKPTVETCEQNPNQEKCKTPKPVAKLKVTKTKLKPAKVKRGKTAKLTITVKNTGKAATNAAKVCVKVNGKAKKAIKAKPACRSLGKIAAGKTKTGTIQLRTTKKAAAKIQVQILASAKGIKTAKKAVTLHTRK